MARRRKSLAPKGRDDDVRYIAGFALGSILTAIIILVGAIAPPATIGPSEGELAPDFSTDAYSGASWENFRLSDSFDYEWEAGEDGEWILIQFIDTDCPYCWSEGEKMSSLHAQWSNNVEFITVAVELSGLSGHNSDRQEIEAFRDKTNYGTDDNDGDGEGMGSAKLREIEMKIWAWVINLLLPSWEIGPEEDQNPGVSAELWLVTCFLFVCFQELEFP